MVGEVASDRLRSLRLAVGDMPLTDDLPSGLNRFTSTAGEKQSLHAQWCRDSR
ncbi:unannotated protein [freshwater metagenome]|uniref:Unannotated protein n=1 Tax=freshwater metagenome TaxID=449393 RepID=A0A6J6USQ0_9ZZZZ